MMAICAVTMLYSSAFAQSSSITNNFPVKGFHIDLRIQVMTMPALKAFAAKLKKSGMNTLIMEYEATYPFQKHPMISNRYAYTPAEIKDFISYCSGLGIDVIPLQQSFGHVEYILRNNRYSKLREDQKDFSQVCPSQPDLDRALFTDLFTELAATHPSKYIHIGGDETYLLGHCPICKKKAETEGLSKLYIDHIKMLCDIVIKLGKRPIIWADIALKYPDALKLLPKETIFIDWNYGWEMNRFGDHSKLMATGFEIWGSPSLRSSPDNYYLTQWEKHFNNIRDFVPASRQLGYKGIVMTSWSTSGIYSSLYDSEASIVDLYAIRRVYPLPGFNILYEAFVKAINQQQALDVNEFVLQYAQDTYGFTKAQAAQFWGALKSAPNEIRDGTLRPANMTMSQLLDTVRKNEKVFNSLVPLKNKTEYEHYKLMSGIRTQYVAFQNLEAQVNSESFTADKKEVAAKTLSEIMAASAALQKRFIEANKGYYYLSELQAETDMQRNKMYGLYARLSKKR